MRKVIFAIVLFLIIFYLGRNLNPFSSTMFTFHDESQPARVQQFALNLKNLKIPPRIAPDFSFKLGFPVFNYYSPFSYWVTSEINLLGVAVAPALKISFLLTLIIGFIFMFKFASLFFDFYPSLLAAILYISSPWLAIEIFIRGDLAEAWFIALFPASLWFLYKNQASKSQWFFLVTTFVISFTLTAHNVLSLIFVPLIIIFAMFLPNKKRGLIAIASSFLLSAYFIIPALTEIVQTHVPKLSRSSDYLDHALCWKQLWHSTWDYGFSIKGCQDSMPFMLGKPQIVLGVLGSIIFLFEIFFIKTKKHKNRLIILSIIFLTLFTIFLTTNSAFIINKFFLPILSLFQFPWRFISFGLFGLAFMAGTIKYPKKFVKIIPISFTAIIIFIIVFNSKFFTKHNLSLNKFNSDLLRPAYISQEVAYKISQFLPYPVDYKKWLVLERGEKDITLKDGLFIHGLDKGKINILQDTPFFKQAVVNSKKIIINVSYLPYWKIAVDDKYIIPVKLDYLGRPILYLKEPSVITVRYEQTKIEKISNIISIFTFIGLIVWIKIKTILNK